MLVQKIFLLLQEAEDLEGWKNKSSIKSEVEPNSVKESYSSLSSRRTIAIAHKTANLRKTNQIHGKEKYKKKRGQQCLRVLLFPP